MFSLMIAFTTREKKFSLKHPISHFGMDSGLVFFCDGGWWWCGKDKKSRQVKSFLNIMCYFDVFSLEQEKKVVQEVIL